MKPRLAVVASHPIQYQAPLWRLLTERDQIEVEVLFASDHGVEPSFDPGLGRVVRFDVPLTEGYAHRFLTNRARRPGPDRFTGEVDPELLWVLDRGRYDVALVQGYAHAAEWFAYAGAFGHGMPYLLRGETPDPPPPVRAGRRWRAKELVLGPLVRHAAGCLAIGLSNARFYLSLGAAPERVVWAPYSVDDRAFRSGGEAGRAERSARLAALGADPERPVVLFAGKLVPRKRPLDLVAAIDRLAAARPGDVPTVLVIGDGEQRDELEQLAADRPWLHLLGFLNQSEIATWYGVADVFVLPSDHETWGLVVNEAMAAGAVPVVSDVVGCGPDLVAGGAGRVFPVGDVTALAGAVAELLDPATRATAATEVARRIERYGLAATAEGVERAAHQAVARPDVARAAGSATGSEVGRPW